MSDERYHRTFLTYDPGVVAAGTGHTRTRAPARVNDMAKEPSPPSNSPYSRYYPAGYTQPSAPAEPYRGQRIPVTQRYAALVMGPNGVEPHPKNIWAKPDQQFNGVATDWEQKNSELCLPTGSFHPVVDSTTMVVAHYAEVLGNRMVSIRLDEEVWESIRDSYLKNNYEQTCNHGTCWYHKPGQGYNGGPIRVGGPNGSWEVPPDVSEVQLLLAAEIPVYVRSATDPMPDGWRAVGSEWSKWAVLAMPNGEVMHAEVTQGNTHTNGTAIPSFSPADIFSIGRLGALLAGAVAKRILTQAARLGYRALGRITSELTKRIEARLAARRAMMGASSTGGRPPVGGGIPGVGAAAAAAVTKQVAKKWKSWGPGNKIYGTTDALEHSARVREIAAAERLAQRGDVEVVWMGGAAREQFKVAVGTQKFPDVIAKKRGVNAYIVSDGKGGVKMPKAIEQFEAAGKTLSANGGRVVENEVLVPPLRPLTQVAPPPQALLAKGYQRLKVVGSLDGREWAVDEAGWLVRTAADPWQHVLANGQRIRVVVVSQ